MKPAGLREAAQKLLDAVESTREYQGENVGLFNDLRPHVEALRAALAQPDEGPDELWKRHKRLIEYCATVDSQGRLLAKMILAKEDALHIAGIYDRYPMLEQARKVLNSKLK